MGASARAENTPAPPPMDSGLTEGVETRLVQFEVRVSRKGAPVSGLTAEDFDIELGGKPLRKFTVDDMCGAGALKNLPGAPSARAGGFILYFDELELTMDGKHRAIEVARLVAPALLARGHELLVLRNEDSLVSETRWTRDPAVVTAALDRIAANPGHGNSLRAEAQQVIVENLLERLTGAIREVEFQNQRALRDAAGADAGGRAKSGARGGGMIKPTRAAVTDDGTDGPNVRAAKTIAMQPANAALSQLLIELQPLVQDELRRVQNDLDRLRSAVRYLALRDSPKGLVYFADTLRRDPGSVVQRTLEAVDRPTGALNDPRGKGADSLWDGSIAPWNADATFDTLVRESSTYGVRFYAVEGRGLAMPSDWVRTSQDTLASMALESGGLSFLNGIAPARIADRVAADQACWYLVSFAPSGWDTDRPLNLAVSMKQDGLRVQTRSELVIPSRATLTETRLIAAHFGDPALEARPLSVSVYPVGGTNKDLTVLAQVRMPESDVPKARDTLWDIGVDLVSRGVVLEHTSSRVTWRGSGQPPVYQATLTLPDGPYEIVAVAHEEASDSIRAGRVHGAWPSTTAGAVALSLPSLAQPQQGGIVLDGQVKASGIVVRGEGNPVDPSTSVAFVTAVCLEGKTETVFRAERRIVGETEVAFTPMKLIPDRGRCVQIRDLVAAHSLGAGRMTYVVRIVSGDDVAASQEFPFEVAEAPLIGDAVSVPLAR